MNPFQGGGGFAGGGGGGAGTLAATLLRGNITGGTDIVVSTGDAIDAESVLTFKTVGTPHWSVDASGNMASTGAETISCLGSAALSERFGAGATAAGQAVAVGNGASAALQGVAIGRNAVDSAGGGVVIGVSATNSGVNSISVGVACSNSGVNNTVVGTSASCGTGQKNVAIGQQATISGAVSFGVAIGADTTVGTNAGMAIGRLATSAGASVAVGCAATATGSNATAFGISTTAGTNSIALGGYATTSSTNQFVVGSETVPITTFWIGEGIVSTTPQALSIYGTYTTTTETDVAGTSVSRYAGAGTGASVGSTLTFYTPVTRASGTARQTQVKRLELSDGLVQVPWDGTNTTDVSCPGAGTNSERFGVGTTAVGDRAFAAGYQASAGGVGAVAIGDAASADENACLALGDGATALFRGIALGNGATNLQQTLGSSLIAIGYNATAGNTGASGDFCIAIGQSALAGGNNSIVIGAQATDNNLSGCVILGTLASSATASAVAIGKSATVSGSGQVVVGFGASTSGSFSVVIGTVAASTHARTTIVGYSAASGGTNSTAIGYSATCGAANSIAFGAYSTTTAANQFVVGGASSPITTVYIGEGVSSATPQALTIQGTNASGTDIDGSSVTYQPGAGTGNSDPTTLTYKTPTRGSSGAVVQTQTKRLEIAEAAFNVQNTELQKDSRPVPHVLNTVTGIDATSTGDTTLYTVPTGKTAIILQVILRVTAATAAGGAMAAGVGINANADDIVASQVLSDLGVGGTDDAFNMAPSIGKFRIADAAEVVKLGIDTADTGTALTLAADVFGYVY
jgi:hypothetical protein